MIIRDELFNGYEIHHDGFSYKVCIPKVSEESGKETLKTVGYYSSVANSVSKIAKLLVDEEDRSYTLNGYYNRFNEVHEGLLNALSIDK